MIADYVFNLSNLSNPYLDAPGARADLSQLLLALASLDNDSGPLPMLRIDKDPWEIPMAESEPGRCLSLAEIAMSFYGTSEHDLAAYFDSLVRAIPSDSGLNIALIEAILRLTPKGPAAALPQTFAAISACEVEAALCSVCDFILASLLRDDRWEHDQMGFTVGTDVYTFDHIATSTHAKTIYRRRLALLRDDIKPTTFWSFKDKAYPHLRFGPDVQQQIERFARPIFPLLLTRFAELDNRASRWKDPACVEFPDGPTPINGETDRTMKRYGGARRFRGIDGSPHTYEDHMWIDRGNRIHMIRDKFAKSVEIGYIGRHLPTMDFPT